MKFPRNRALVYLVERVENNRQIPLAAFKNDTDADEYRGVCEQQWLDIIGELNGIQFRVNAVVFYG